MSPSDMPRRIASAVRPSAQAPHGTSRARAASGCRVRTDRSSSAPPRPGSHGSARTSATGSRRSDASSRRCRATALSDSPRTRKSAPKRRASSASVRASPSRSWSTTSRRGRVMEPPHAVVRAGRCATTPPTDGRPHQHLAGPERTISPSLGEDGAMAPLAPSAYDVDRIRWHFPALHEGAAHFDGPGGSQVPDTVATAVVETLTSAISNRGSVTPAERRADRVVVEARAAMGDLLSVEPGGVVFGRSATELTFHLARTLSSDWGPGDEVVVSRLDHDANVRPWVLAAAARGATVRWAEFDPSTGELAPEAVAAVVGERTRLVAVTAASNLIGTRPDLPAIAEIAHAAGALLWVDGVHATAHVLTDVPASGADFWVCSPYKFLGPHHGVLAAAPALLES